MNRFEAIQALQAIEIASLICNPQNVKLGESFTVRIRLRRPLQPEIGSSLDQWNQDNNRLEFVCHALTHFCGY